MKVQREERKPTFIPNKHVKGRNRNIRNKQG